MLFFPNCIFYVDRPPKHKTWQSPAEVRALASVVLFLL